jgi:pSer/pThr/pTyr-binding forkhead associated (FHA) protein
MPYLEHDGATRELPTGETLVGSGSEVDWRLQTINLAPRHFSIRIDEQGGAILSPYKSHDVDVNGEPVDSPRALQHGDEIIAGAGIFSYLQTLEQEAAPASGPATIYLIDIGAGVAYPLADDTITIGRDPVNQIAVRDSSVSRFHAEVRSTADKRGFVFRSMGAGGSTINGALVGSAPRALVEGDIIRIASTKLRFTAVPPPPVVKIVTKGDASGGGRNRHSTQNQRVAEPRTLGRGEPITMPSLQPTSGTSRWITVALVTTAGLLLVLLLHAIH